MIQEAHVQSESTRVPLPTLTELQAFGACLSADQTCDDRAPLMDTAVDMAYLYQQVRHPIKHYLRAQHVHVIRAVDEYVHQEPLSLSSLERYQVNTKLLDLMSRPNHTAQLDDLLYDPVLPAGVARQSALHYQSQHMRQQCHDFAAQLQAAGVDTGSHSKLLLDEPCAWLTPCEERSVRVHIAPGSPPVIIKGVIPKNTGDHDGHSPKTWLNILPNSPRADHLLRFWLMHVFWQVARGTTPQQVAVQDGRSIWRFNKAAGKDIKAYEGHDIFELAPIGCDEAKAELIKWLRFGQLAAEYPISILPNYALIYLQNSRKMMDKGERYTPTHKDFDGWIEMPYHTKTSSGEVYDTCAKHPLWQYVLGDTAPMSALTQALSATAPVLFAPMFDALTPFKTA